MIADYYDDEGDARKTVLDPTFVSSGGPLAKTSLFAFGVPAQGATSQGFGRRRGQAAGAQQVRLHRACATGAESKARADLRRELREVAAEGVPRGCREEGRGLQRVRAGQPRKRE